MFVQAPEGRSVIEVAREFPACLPEQNTSQGNNLNNSEIDTRLDKPSCGPERGKANNMFVLDNCKIDTRLDKPTVGPERDETDNMLVSDNIEYNTRLDKPTVGPGRGKSTNLFDSDTEDNIQEKHQVTPPCSEEVLRIITLLENPPSDLSDDFLNSRIFALEQHSSENSEPEQASDSEWEDEVETLCEPTVSQPAVTTNTNKPSQASFLPHSLQDNPLNASFIRKLASRRIFKPGNGSPPEKTSRIPISVWIFGVRLNGILDTGSERSYINEKVYEDIKHLAAGELQDDQTKKGVLLANHSTCKSRGGAPFIIQIGSVAGEQYLSVLPDLGYSLVLGMDFATRFEVQIDCKNCTWKFSDSPEVFLFQPINCHEKSAQLCAMSELQETKVKRISGG
ncbi:hypothetical protein KQX54_008588 [Cotesia glomerata]|uniref:Peptidase A2 domain-containing protein n=1 Tax=Cotesia glomerata TaxID=32391 RepID=A0AAV7HXM3_COTGL|nr:hypothetical protein KQX54_008588 [Cotesia glomerata]